MDSYSISSSIRCDRHKNKWNSTSGYISWEVEKFKLKYSNTFSRISLMVIQIKCADQEKSRGLRNHIKIIRNGAKIQLLILLLDRRRILKTILSRIAIIMKQKPLDNFLLQQKINNNNKTTRGLKSYQILHLKYSKE